jgi:hypothetical protein
MAFHHPRPSRMSGASWVFGSLGLWVLGLGSGSWVLGLGSWVLGLGSKVLDLLLSMLLSSHSPIFFFTLLPPPSLLLQPRHAGDPLRSSWHVRPLVTVFEGSSFGE